MNKTMPNADIDLLEVLMTIWNNKMKVVLISIIATLAILYFTKSPNVNKFKMTSTTKSISSFDEFDYNGYNFLRDQYFSDGSTGFYNLGKSYMLKIDKLFLFNLFMKILEEEVLAEGIKKFNLVKKENYKNEKAYLSAIERFISSVEISTLENQYEGRIKFVAYDEDTKKKWENLINSLQDSTNRLVQIYLKELMNESQKSYENIKRNQLFDIEESIRIALTEYDLEIEKRIAFLKEQAQLARTMSKFPDYETLPNNILYYLRGYQVIEKEIELIVNRKDKLSFATGTTNFIEKKNAIINNKSFERVHGSLAKTPIFNDDKFFAGLIMSGSSEFSTNAIPIYKRIAIAAIFGMIIGIFYALIANALLRRLKRSNGQ